MKQYWDDILSSKAAEETGYPEQQVSWLVGILYKHHKSMVRTKSSLFTLLKACKAENVTNLYQIYSSLIESGIVKKKDILREYREAIAEKKRIKERPSITDTNWFHGFM